MQKESSLPVTMTDIASGLSFPAETCMKFKSTAFLLGLLRAGRPIIKRNT